MPSNFTRFIIPKITTPINLLDYDAAIEVTVNVWVNPTRELLDQHATALRGGDVPLAQAVYAALWDWTLEDVQALEAADPACSAWLMRETLRALAEHRVSTKKKSTTP